MQVQTKLRGSSSAVQLLLSVIHCHKGGGRVACLLAQVAVFPSPSFLLREHSYRPSAAVCKEMKDTEVVLITKGGGVPKSEVFADVICLCPLCKLVVSPLFSSAGKCISPSSYPSRSVGDERMKGRRARCNSQVERKGRGLGEFEVANIHPTTECALRVDHGEELSF